MRTGPVVEEHSLFVNFWRSSFLFASLWAKSKRTLDSRLNGCAGRVSAKANFHLFLKCCFIYTTD